LAWSRAHGTGAASRPGRSIYLAGDAQRTDFFRARAGPGRARGCHAQGPGRAVALAFSRNDALACPAKKKMTRMDVRIEIDKAASLRFLSSP